jgi:hypothetical protein
MRDSYGMWARSSMKTRRHKQAEDMQANSIIGVLFSLYSISTTSGAAQESLVEPARRMEGKAEAVVELHVPRMTVPEMMAASRLILRGRIASATPRLSEAQGTVYTEYTVEPVEILKLPSALVTASKPGIAPPIVFIQIGGELEVDGLRLRTTTNTVDPENPISLVSEYWLFLGPAASSPSTTTRVGSRAYQLTNSYSIFPIVGGHLTTPTRAIANSRPLPTDDPEEFGNLIRAEMKKAKQ